MSGNGCPRLMLMLILVLAGCMPTKLVRQSLNPDTIKIQKASSQFVKIHLKDGGLYVLKDWTINKTRDTISGYGDYYDYRRKLSNPHNESYKGTRPIFQYDVPRKNITLLETDQLGNGLTNMAAITIVGVPLGILAVYCIANPKACFGSCPTFYAQKDGQFSLMAEGFSSSIAPSFEKTDIDMLYRADDSRDSVSLRLTNEALETHVIRYVDLLAFPASNGEKVFATENGMFCRTSQISPPDNCSAGEGDCLELIKELDGKERFNGSDSRNLAKKEEMVLTFRNDQEARQGLLIASRQSLLTTHLFYQVMAYTGNYYGDLISEVENGNSKLRRQVQKLWDRLGGIEVFLQKDRREWVKIGEINEMGPIAADVHLIKLPSIKNEKITIKLIMTKGLWRIDYLALAKIMGEETPVRIKPHLVLKNDTADLASMVKLNDRTEPLVTAPGDRFELRYQLPPNCPFQYFIETKGYYLEWMRDEWLAEENLRKAGFALYFPKQFYKKAAARYKKVEPELEKIFWESRYVRQ